ncbi:hypothetical protein B0A49_11321, partial [Cryomyces minteri]
MPLLSLSLPILARFPLPVELGPALALPPLVLARKLLVREKGFGALEAVVARAIAPAGGPSAPEMAALFFLPLGPVTPVPLTALALPVLGAFRCV